MLVAVPGAAIADALDKVHGLEGKTAIDAAAKPKTNDYLYWVTINLDTKETKFSKTLDEHNRYVEQYNAWCTANVGRCT